MYRNTDSAFSGKLKPSKRRHPCPICNNITGFCKYDPLGDMILCHNFDRDVNGYKFVKKTVKDVWGIFFPEGKFNASPDAATLSLQEERRLERERLKKQQQALSLSDSERNSEYFKLIDQLSLNYGDKLDLLKRGLTEEQIRKGEFVSAKKWQPLREYIDPNLAGVNVSGMGLTNFYDGLLCFAKNPKGEIVGHQIRALDKSVDSKYVWAVSKANDRRSVDATVHLKDTGELPLNCEFINPVDKVLRLCEGILKPKIAALLRNQNFMGASGGNFVGSPETFKSNLEYFKPTIIVLCPDKKSLQNTHVLENWRRTREFLVNLGYDVYVEVWEDSDNYDVDEYPIGSITQIISYMEWDKDYKNIADIESPVNKFYEEWLNDKNFTPNLTINQQYLTDPSLKLPWKDGDTYFIKSGLGTGKTTWLIDALKEHPEMRKFALGKINNLLLQFVAKDGTFCHYQEHDGYILKKDVNTNFALCINSLPHFDSEDFDGSVVIIDEIASVVKQLYSSFLGDRRNKVIQMFEEAMRRAAVVVCMDGTLTDRTADFITTLRGKTDNVYKVLNKCNPKRFDIRFMQTVSSESGKFLSKDLSGVFKKALSHTKPVFITATSQKNCKILEEIAIKQGKKVFRLDSETSPEDYAKRFLADPNSYILENKPDVVIVSPSGGEGLDISIRGYFEGAYHIGNCLDADTNFQMISRLRDKKVTRFVYAVHKGFISEEDSMPRTMAELMRDNMSNLLGELPALSCKEQLQELRKRLKAYETSLHFEMPAKLRINSNFETEHLRDCLTLMLQKAGHKISFVEINDDKKTKAEIKETKERITEEEITATFNAEDIPDNVGKKWDRNSQGLNKEQRYQFTKWKYKQILPGIADTEHWNITLIETLIKKRKLISQLTLGYLFKNPEKAKRLAELKLIKLLEQEYNPYYDAKPSYYEQVKFLQKSCIECLIEEKGYLFDSNDDWVSLVHAWCEKPYAKRLGFGACGKDVMKTVNKVLNSIGLRTERKHSHQDGGRVIKYHVLPLSEMEQAIEDAIARRIDERITKADSDAKSETEYPDFASERTEEPDTDVYDHLSEEEFKTSVSATPLTGSRIELSLPMDFYFKSALLYDAVNGKVWEVVEYVQIHGKDYVDLKGESGDKVKIPLDWILYCVDCVA